MIEKIPPHNIDSEQAILAGILVNNDMLQVAQDIIDPSDFYREAHQIIFTTYQTLYQKPEPIDLITVSNLLRLQNKLEQIGGEEYLASLTDKISTSAGIPYYARIVKECSNRRKLINLCSNIGNQAYKGDLDELVSKIIENITPFCGDSHNKSQLVTYSHKLSLKKRNIAQDVQDFVKSQTGHFLVTECLMESQLVTKEEKHAAVVELTRLCKAGIIEKFGERRGSYRVADKDCEDIDIINVNEDDIMDIKWPFGIEDYFRTFPKNIIVIAGEKNAGKSAFLMNFAKLNMHNYKTNYFSSEMGAMELRDRLSKFEDMNFEDWTKISFKERSSNFADVIKPDEINIIDFLELHDNFYLVSGLIRNIFDKLKYGIAVIAIQKPHGRDEALGGEKSAEKARLYLPMSSGLIKIKWAKNWVNSRINPNGLIKRFSLVQGCRFIEQSTWEPEMEMEMKEKYKSFIPRGKKYGG